MKSTAFTVIYFLAIIFASFFSYAAEYKTRLLGTESFSGVQWTVKGINDKGQVFGGYTEWIPDQGERQTIFITEINGELSLIENDRIYVHNHFVINNNSQIAGPWNGPTRKFIWSKIQGICSLSIFDPSDAHFQQLNDLGQLIGAYNPHDEDNPNQMIPFLWNNGVSTNMGVGSEFAKQFEDLGYKIISIKLMSINNKGELAGYFRYGKYNQKQNKIVPAGYKTFFWNGSAHILPLLSDTEIPEIVKLNYHGVVLVTTSKWKNEQTILTTTYLWTFEHGLQILPDFYGIDLNNAPIVLGYITDYSDNKEYHVYQVYQGSLVKGIPAIWKNGQYVTVAELLGVSDIHNIISPYSDDYEVEQILNIVQINNKGQIACQGYLWGENHPCILEPVK
jgi:hypothetical protein